MISPVRNTYPNVNEDAKRWVAAMRRVLVVRAIAVDKHGEVVQYAPLTKIKVFQAVFDWEAAGKGKMRKSLWIILAVLLVAIGPPAARADIVTLDVSGSLTASGGASCSSSGCTLGGNIVINNTTGAVISTDVTFSGESPSVGPFDGVNQVVADGALTGLGIADSTGSFLPDSGVFHNYPRVLGRLLGRAPRLWRGQHEERLLRLVLEFGGRPHRGRDHARAEFSRPYARRNRVSVCDAETYRSAPSTSQLKRRRSLLHPADR